MANLEPVTLEGRSYALRHIGPAAAIFPNGLPVAVSLTPVLNQPSMVGRDLPMASVPNSTDFAFGQWAGRLQDASEMQLTFPNKEATDGTPWRNRFDASLKNQWIEIRSDGYPEAVCCIEKVEKLRDQIVISGHDGLWQTKNAYERDWIVVQAPRDVIERGTQLWINIASDDFSYQGSATPLTRWHLTQTNGGTVSLANNGGLLLSIPAVSTTTSEVNLLCGTGADGGFTQGLGSGQVWSNPGNITADDSLYASSFLPSPGGSTTDNLYATNFGFAIPVGATINGIVAEAQVYSPTGVVQTYTAQLMKAGAPIDSTAGKAGPSDTWATFPGALWQYGGNTDLWGTTWSAADINNSGFGFALAAIIPAVGGNGPDTGYVNSVDITVYYTSTATLPVAMIDSGVIAVKPTGVWSSNCNVQYSNLSGGDYNSLTVTESDGTVYGIRFFGANQTAVVTVNGSAVASVVVPTSVSYSLLLESDGEWVWPYINGQYLANGGVRRLAATTSSIKTSARITTISTGTAATGLLTSLYTRCLQPALMRGTDKGDYALPSITGFAVGTISSYPTGGLHARYYNNADLGSDTNRLIKVHHHARSSAYVGSNSGPGEYANQQDTQIAAQANASGAAASNWSAIWFGAVYLVFNGVGTNSYTFTITLPAVANDVTARLYIGKTTFGTQIIDQWASYNNGSGQVLTATLAGNALAGSLSYGGGSIVRDGWYPFKLEYSVDATAAAAPTLAFKPPVGYTDPGGTVLTANASVTIPATSLSPLGCVDQRHQAVSHFDLIQKTAQAFGYQVACEPQTLESGLFPGVVAPRFREGQDFDPVLEPDEHIRSEPILNYGNVLDATDCCTSLFGNGAGFANGNTGQLQAYVFDHTSQENALFDIQAWQDFSDSAFRSLLEAQLTSQLGLRLTPWQIISGDPMARERLAHAWPLPIPLTATLAQLRWRPGDGMRVFARDVGIQDTAPRQLLMVTRQIHPNGTTGAAVSFAERPREGNYVVRQLLSQAQRWARNYQRGKTTLPGTRETATLVAGATDANSSLLVLGSGLTVVRAWLVISANSGNVNLGVKVNFSADLSNSLNGPWKIVPVILDIGGYAAIGSDHRLVVQLVNQDGAVSTTVDYQVFLEVLR